MEAVRDDRRLHPFNRSEHDRWKDAAKDAPFELLTEAHEEFKWNEHCLRGAILERIAEMFDLPVGVLYSRTLESCLGCSWFLGEFHLDGKLSFFYSPGRTPSPSKYDWYSEQFDPDHVADAKIYTNDRYTLVMTEGEGMVLAETMLRCDPIDFGYGEKK